MAYQSAGYYLEEFELGKCYESAERTITETDVVGFAGLSGDFNQLHLSEEFAKKGMFGRRIAHGALGLIIATGLSVQMRIFEGTDIAFLELTARYTAPLYIGDTIHLELTPTEIIHSKKPDRGVLKLMARLITQDGRCVLESPWSIMMKTKPLTTNGSSEKEN